MYKETEDIENAIQRLLDAVGLNVNNPTKNIKVKYHKAVMALMDAKHEFEILNDMKETHKKLNRG